MRGRGTRTHAQRKPVVVVAGEDSNDRKSLRIVLEAHCPDMRGRIVEIKDSVRLRGASENTLRARVDVLKRKAAARAAREKAEIACLFVHEDLDAPDTAQYIETHARVQRAFDSAFDSAHYVLAAAETEAWLLLFPDAIAGHVTTWNVPAKYRNKNTGVYSDPKQILADECSGPGKRTYLESDCPEILQRVVDLGVIDKPSGKNESWNRLRSDIGQCGTEHLQPKSRKRKA